MAKKVFFNQCWMEKRIEGGLAHTTSWIPEQFAKVGKTLKLRQNGVWEDGWKVKMVGARLSEEYLPDAHDDIKALRKATGDSLPK